MKKIKFLILFGILLSFTGCYTRVAKDDEPTNEEIREYSDSYGGYIDDYDNSYSGRDYEAYNPDTDTIYDERGNVIVNNYYYEDDDDDFYPSYGRYYLGYYPSFSAVFYDDWLFWGGGIYYSSYHYPSYWHRHYWYATPVYNSYYYEPYDVYYYNPNKWYPDKVKYRTSYATRSYSGNNNYVYRDYNGRFRNNSNNSSRTLGGASYSSSTGKSRTVTRDYTSRTASVTRAESSREYQRAGRNIGTVRNGRSVDQSVTKRSRTLTKSKEYTRSGNRTYVRTRESRSKYYSTPQVYKRNNSGKSKVYTNSRSSSKARTYTRSTNSKYKPDVYRKSAPKSKTYTRSSSRKVKTYSTPNKTYNRSRSYKKSNSSRSYNKSSSSGTTSRSYNRSSSSRSGSRSYTRSRSSSSGSRSYSRSSTRSSSTRSTKRR